MVATSVPFAGSCVAVFYCVRARNFWATVFVAPFGVLVALSLASAVLVLPHVGQRVDDFPKWVFAVFLGWIGAALVAPFVALIGGSLALRLLARDSAS